MPKEPKDCKDNQVYNTASKRCVSKDGRIGKKILKDAQKKSSEKSKSPINSNKGRINTFLDTPCKDITKIRNPKSGRCVSREGKIGKKVLQDKLLLVPKSSPKSYRKSSQKTPGKYSPKSVQKSVPKSYPKYKTWEYLTIPITVSEHYSSKYNKHIYILGDQHIKNVHCPKGKNLSNSINLTEFLSYLSSFKSPEVVDYFFEYALKTRLKPNVYDKYRGHGQEIYDAFENCFQVQKELCQFDNVRMHYADTRGSLNIKYVQDLMFYIINLESYIIYNGSSNLVYFSHLELKVKELISLVSNQNNLIKTLLEMSKVNKQLDNLEFPEIKSLVENELQREMEKCFKILTPDFIKMLYDLGTKIENGSFKSSPQIEHIIKDASKKIVDGLGYLMDMYLFPRMFRKFKKNAKLHSEPPTNIVVIVGDWHARNYRRLLDKLGFTSKESKSVSEKVDFQCVNISNFVQPFFSEHNLNPNEVYA